MICIDVKVICIDVKVICIDVKVICIDVKVMITTLTSPHIETLSSNLHVQNEPGKPKMNTLDSKPSAELDVE